MIYRVSPVYSSIWIIPLDSSWSLHTIPSPSLTGLLLIRIGLRLSSIGRLSSFVLSNSALIKYTTPFQVCGQTSAACPLHALTITHGLLLSFRRETDNSCRTLFLPTNQFPYPVCRIFIRKLFQERTDLREIPFFDSRKPAEVDPIKRTAAFLCLQFFVCPYQPSRPVLFICLSISAELTHASQTAISARSNVNHCSLFVGRLLISKQTLIFRAHTHPPELVPPMPVNFPLIFPCRFALSTDI